MRLAEPEIRFFDKGQIREVLAELQKEDYIQSVYPKIKGMLDQALRELIIPTSVMQANGFAVKAGMRNVSLRAETLQLMLDVMRRRVKQDVYSAVLRDVGELIGADFIEDFIHHLRKINWMPRHKDYNILLETWADFDTSAGLGRISVISVRKDQVKIYIKDNPLTMNYINNRHRHCAFFEGYVAGVIGYGLPLYSKWCDERGLKSPPGHTRVRSVHESEDNAGCMFIASLSTEKFPLALNEIYKASEKLMAPEPDLVSALVHARNAMDISLKISTGLGSDDKTGFSAVMKAAYKARWPINIDEVYAVYDYTSKSGAHPREEPTRDETEYAVAYARGFVSQIERFEPSQHLKEFNEALLRIKEKKLEQKNSASHIDEPT